MRSLLIHADDFGMSQGVVDGVLAAMTRGAVTATSAMVCDPASRERVARLAGRVGGRVGLHLQLTDGAPVADPSSVPTLVDASGRFPRRGSDLGRPDPREILSEWRAQLDALRSLGVEPSHIDTHHSVHEKPEVEDAYLRFALETKLPARGATIPYNRRLRERGVACADAYITLWTGGPVKAAALSRALRAMARYVPEDGFLEIGCHPAEVDEELTRRSTYAGRRAEELAVLCQPELPDVLRELGYRLAPPDELRRRASESATADDYRRPELLRR